MLEVLSCLVKDAILLLCTFQLGHKDCKLFSFLFCFVIIIVDPSIQSVTSKCHSMNGLESICV